MADIASTTNFIGRGFAYPFGFDSRTGGVSKDIGNDITQKLQRILWSIQQIIGIRRGEVFFLRSFGSQAKELVFRPNDVGFQNLVEFAITQAIERWEKRIRLSGVLVSIDPNNPAVADVQLSYVIRRSNVTGNLTYPLFLGDAQRAAADRGLIGA